MLIRYKYDNYISYVLAGHISTMDNNYFSIIEEDLNIKNTLVDNGIINNIRIRMCGQWTNITNKKELNIKKNYTRYFCKKWECRFCRRKLIKRMISNHIKYQKNFLSNGGKIILITLTIPNFIYNQDIDFHAKFKKSISILKESRGWEKLKNLTNGQFHYDNIELTFTNNEYQLFDHIIYGVMNDNIEISILNNILYDYWSKSIKRNGLKFVSIKSVNVAYTEDSENRSMIDFKFPSINFGDKTFELRNKISGSLENYEYEYMKIYRQPTTLLKSLEYTKYKRLKDIGIVIKNINTMLKNSRHGRIWENLQ